MICGWCKRPYQDDDIAPGFCSKRCRHTEHRQHASDAHVDWFAIRLRQFIVSQAWSERERSKRCRPEDRPVRYRIPEIDDAALVSDDSAAV